MYNIKNKSYRNHDTIKMVANRYINIKNASIIIFNRMYGFKINFFLILLCY